MLTQARQRYINIYTEANPNPASLKFAINEMLVPEGTDFDYPNAAAAQGSPLAAALFAEFPFVERVFLMSNFVTITKNDSVEWNEVAPTVKNWLKSWLEEERPILSVQTMADYEEAANTPDSELVRRIKQLLDEYVRPAVESDGGAITFQSFDEGVVTVQLRGSCSGCPSSTLTLKAGIENLLTRMVPEVKSVVAQAA